MTCGFDVLVQLVIAAITTEPWSSSNSSPFVETRIGLEGLCTGAPPEFGGGETGPPPRGSWYAVGSLAGKVSATASSSPS